MIPLQRFSYRLYLFDRIILDASGVSYSLVLFYLFGLFGLYVTLFKRVLPCIMNIFFEIENQYRPWATE